MNRLLIAASMLLLAACNPESRGTVLLMGDSLMSTTATMTQMDISMRDRAAIPVYAAIPSIKTVEGYWPGRVATIEENAQPDLIIVSLGGNDANSKDYDPVRFAEAIDAILWEVPPDTPVFWITPHTGPGLVYRDQLDSVREEILLATERWPNATLVDYEDWIAKDGAVLGDMLDRKGVHFNGAGGKAWTALVASIVTDNLQEGE